MQTAPRIGVLTNARFLVSKLAILGETVKISKLRYLIVNYNSTVLTKLIKEKRAGMAEIVATYQ